MTHTLPPQSTRRALEFGHFPTRMQCFIFRNWGMIAPAVLGEVLGCPEDTVRALAGEMGLDAAQNADPAWLEKGYITILRANWHLCSYAQLETLLGWSEQQLAFVLREDDFLSVKLGNEKPACPPLRYAALTDQQRTETARIREIVQNAQQNLPPNPVKPFAFAFSEAAPQSDTLPAPRQTRILYAYCALYGDTFADERLLELSFPDALLESYQKLGVTGVWTQAVLYTLAPYPFDPSMSDGWERRLAGMRALRDRLKRYGLKLYLYLNEPRALPLSFFALHPELLGHREGDYACLCVSTPEVQAYLRDAAHTICQNVPGLGGFITITASENLTNCYSHAAQGSCNCARCASRTPAAVIADVNRLLYEGGASADPEIDLLAWNWSWNGRMPDMTARTISALPDEIGLLCVSEEGVRKTIGGVETSVIDYSLSVEGPGDFAQNAWQYAHKAGHRAYAKLQLNNTWEMAAVPCVPVFEKIYRHLTKLRRAGIDGAMLGWTLGGFPSPTLQMARLILDAPGEPPTLEQLYAQLFPDADLPSLQNALHLLSEAFDAFPFHIGTAYNAPQLYGCANLLYETPTGYPASMVGNPYDDLDAWRSIFPAEIFLSQLQKLSEGWRAGRLALEESARRGGVPDYLLRWTAAIDCQFRSMYNQSRFVYARNAAQPIDPTLLSQEITDASELLSLCARDASIGYESSNHYFFTRSALLEKLLCCDRILRIYNKEGKIAK